MINLINHSVSTKDSTISCSKFAKAEENLRQLSSRLKKADRPVFIELIGTPKSGKTTLKNALVECFSKFDIDVIARRETAEYNPVPKNSDNYNIWMVLELFKNISEDLSKNTGQVILYDRGILDRIPWMKFDVSRNNMNQADFDRIFNLYQMQNFSLYKPVTQVFETSPELSIQRKGAPGFFVNTDTINAYNGFLRQTLPDIQNHSASYNYVITDTYQGKIKDFILDSAISITRGVSRVLDQRTAPESPDNR